jgi:hypothetical protein
MTEEQGKGIAPVDRPLSQEETDLLNGFRNADEWLPQIRRLKVIGTCTCGCPTIYFAFDGVPVKRKGEQLISDHLASVDGMPVGVMVFQTGGHISSLEVYSLPGSDKPFGLPMIESMLGPEDPG